MEQCLFLVYENFIAYNQKEMVQCRLYSQQGQSKISPDVYPYYSDESDTNSDITEMCEDDAAEESSASTEDDDSSEIL